MPLTIVNKTYEDLLGISENYLFFNAGDTTKSTIRILERIQVVGSLNNVLFVNLYDDTITWSNGNWLKEGFAIGDVIYVKRFDATGGVITTNSSTIIAIYGTGNSILKLSYASLTTAILPNLGNQDFLGVFEATDYRSEELLISINYVASGSTGGEYSLIDGEPTIFSFNIGGVAGFPNLIPNNTILNGIQIGKKSGTFKTTAKLSLNILTPQNLGFEPSFGVCYDLIIDSTNSGALLPNNFLFNNCIKMNIKLENARFLGQPFNRNYFYLSDDANTGRFDEPYNISVGDSVLVSGINSFSFDSTETHTAIINVIGSAIANSRVCVGACYIPQDESYYKNNFYNLSESCIALSTTKLLDFPEPSEVNLDGAGYTLNVSVTGTTTKNVSITFTPNSAFTDFMQSREEGDRLFYVWVKVGTINHLVFSGQLESNPPIGGALTLEQNIFLDHSENVLTSNSTILGYEANKEDDLAFVGTFLLDKNKTYDSFSAGIIAKNGLTGEDFNLLNAFFNFNSVPFIAGQYALPMSQPIITTLPNTSVKETAYLSLAPTYDTSTQYGVQIYLPFLLRWEYWLNQLNANIVFYPNQNKNWLTYGTTIDWGLKLNLELSYDGLGYFFEDDIIIKDYDSSTNIFQDIEVSLFPSGTIVTNVVANNIHKITATHTKIDGSAFEPNTWGMITIEPKESAPRSIISSVVPFDNDSNNPLSNIGGVSLMPLNFITPSICVMECLFDSDKINLLNGVKITTKIKEKI